MKSPGFDESCIVYLAAPTFDSPPTAAAGHRASPMRAFPFRHKGRVLRVVVVSVQEAWQLWVCEEERRLAYGGRVSVDDAIAGWRLGDDRVLELAEEVKSNVLTGKLVLDMQAQLTGGVVAADEAAPSADALPASHLISGRS